MIVGISIALIITSLLMVVLVLLHKGKGGGLSNMFGGGVSSSLDLGLYFVEKFWGVDARIKVAAQMEYRGYSPI